jgi:putative addiction module component (TIGR02574 family)
LEVIQVSVRIARIEEEVFRLPFRERALLAEHLISSLDEEEDPEAERLWIEEAERRYKEYKKGKVKAKPAEVVFKEARAKLR